MKNDKKYAMDIIGRASADLKLWQAVKYIETRYPNNKNNVGVLHEASEATGVPAYKIADELKRRELNKAYYKNKKC